MLVSYEWLNEYVDVHDIDAYAIAERMSRTGIEVDGVERLGEGLKKVVVGHVVSIEEHPDSDHLHVCQVDVGDSEPIQIVCGAPNVDLDQKVIVALPNSRIKDNIKIKKGKLRGVVSMGMICSLEEIGFSNSVVPKQYTDGIMVLPEDAPVGEDITTYLELNDPVLDLDITPNRADALSMRGAAWEIGAIYNRKIKLNSAEDLTPYTEGSNLSDALKLEVDNPSEVKEYNAFLIRDVKVGPSPLNIQLRLMKAGIRPINNIVDATNYVLLEYGQPLHAFDYDKLEHKHIVTRMAKVGETLATLDGVERALLPEDIVITDGEKPIALAGVMGGLSTEIDDNTTTVLIESAIFKGTTIRHTARRLSLHSESSMRNERGVNSATTAEAGAYAVKLMKEWGHGKPELGLARCSTVSAQPVEVSTSLSYVNQMLGMSLAFSDIERVFSQLGFEVGGDAQRFTVSVPPRRWDITIPSDLVEEVARIYGYDKLPSVLPKTRSYKVGLSNNKQFQRRLNRNLQALGFDQVISYSLTGPSKLNRFEQRDVEAVKLDFPMSDERSIMRTNLLTSLIDVAHYNSARNIADIQIYEVARVFNWDNAHQSPVESNHLAGVWIGKQQPDTWETKARPVDFYALKGRLESLFQTLNLDTKLSYQRATALCDMHPGRTAEIYAKASNDESIKVGYFGQIHPESAHQYDLPLETFVFELSLDVLYQLPQRSVVQHPLPKYPGINRDIALIVDEAVTHAEIVETIELASKGALINVQLFDIYRGESIGAERKSMAYQLNYLNPESTLVDDEVNKDIERIESALIEKLRATIR